MEESETHSKQCKECDSTITKAHNLKCIDNEDGTHTTTCLECNYIVIEEHNYSGTDNGDGTHTIKCEKCANESIKEHIFIGIDNGDGTHSIKCQECEFVKVIEQHNLSYTNNQDGTHTGKCTNCEYTLTENHSHEKGKCICGHEEIQITIEKYKEEGSYISGVQPGETVSELISNLNTNASTVKVSNNGEELEGNDKIATGMKIELKKENDTKIITIVVNGDTNGDGQAEIKDILVINKHRLNKTKLTNEFLVAGDVNGDGEVNIRDILQLNKFRLGKISEL